MLAITVCQFLGTPVPLAARAYARARNVARIASANSVFIARPVGAPSGSRLKV
jgi:hypothetical protein